MAEVRLSAETRSEFGKGAARRIRRAAKVPAVIYGHGTDPVHVTLPGHDTMLALKHANVLLELDIDGRLELTLPKHVQRDPLKQSIEHLDLLVVKRGEKVTVDVAVHVTGEVASGAMVSQENTTVSLEALATAIPESIELDITGAQAGTQFHASDLVLPEGASLAGDPELLVVNVTAESAAEPTAAEAGEAADATAAEATAAE